jgi:hypothetical protein
MTFKLPTVPLTKLELGQAGFDYIRRHFERGTSFCQEVLLSAFSIAMCGSIADSR